MMQELLELQRLFTIVFHMESEKALFIAIDGGGTKTDAVLFNADGSVFAVEIGGPLNLNLLRDTQLKREFLKILNRFRRKLGGEIPTLNMVFAGLAGGYNLEARIRAENVLKSLLFANTKLVVSHDAVNSLWCGTDGKSGIAVIAGTGSIIFGMNSASEEIRLGGWGHLISDDGSGYDIGRLALKAIMDSYDGIGADTALTAIILNSVGILSPPGIIPLAYREGKPFIASLSRCVLEAYQQKDKVAETILNNVCSKLTTMLNVGISRASKTGGWDVPYRVVLTGGLWNSDVFTSIFRRKIEDKCLDVKLIIPDLPPVYGAACYLMHLNGLKTGDEFGRTFFSSYIKKRKEAEG